MSSERRRRSATNRVNVAEDRTKQPLPPSDEAIRDRAYEIYEGRGGKIGADLDDWLQAERELRGDRE